MQLSRLVLSRACLAGWLAFPLPLPLLDLSLQLKCSSVQVDLRDARYVSVSLQSRYLFLFLFHFLFHFGPSSIYHFPSNSTLSYPPSHLPSIRLPSFLPFSSSFFFVSFSAPPWLRTLALAPVRCSRRPIFDVRCFDIISDICRLCVKAFSCRASLLSTFRVRLFRVRVRVELWPRVRLSSRARVHVVCFIAQ